MLHEVHKKFNFATSIGNRIFLQMKFSYHIHHNYTHRRNEIEQIPSRFENEGEVMYQLRNCIKKIGVNEEMWNVKSFQIPITFNQFIYRHIRRSKAERSYKTALQLLKLGISTPQPIAYIVEKNLLGIRRSYYITQQIDYDYTLGDLFRNPPQDAPQIITECLKYISSFHRKGLFFIDLSVGNILIKRQPDGGFTFYLIDLNRASFYNRPLTCSESVKAFCRLDTTYKQKQMVLQQYAQISGFSYDEVMQHYKQHEEEDNRRRRMKKYHLKQLRKTLFSKKR